MQAADIMTRGVVTISSHFSIMDAMRLMLVVRISGLPVTDGFGRLVGILTKGDLLRRELKKLVPNGSASCEVRGDWRKITSARAAAKWMRS